MEALKITTSTNPYSLRFDVEEEEIGGETKEETAFLGEEGILKKGGGDEMTVAKSIT